MSMFSSIILYYFSATKNACTYKQMQDTGTHTWIYTQTCIYTHVHKHKHTEHTYILALLHMKLTCHNNIQAYMQNARKMYRFDSLIVISLDTAVLHQRTSLQILSNRLMVQLSASYLAYEDILLALG